MYRYETGVDKDYLKAEYALAELYESGGGVKKDLKKAVELYQKVANQNNSDALYTLAKLYKEGKIVEQNYSKTVELYKKISETNNYNVFYELAALYDEGKGVAQDHDIADELYRKASKLRYDEAREYVDPKNKPILKLGRKSSSLASTARKTTSFLGTKPQVVSHFEWPQVQGVTLTFIGQLDLGEINKNKAIPWLPEKSRLLFFYDIVDQPWGTYPKDQQSSRVLYDEGVGDLQVQEHPSSLKRQAYIQAIKYLRADDLVSYPNAAIGDRIGFASIDDFESYQNFFGEYYAAPSSGHQIDGYPLAVQVDSMEGECQDIDFANTLRKSTNDDWKLLLQLNSDDDIGLMWSDVGRLYFWVRE